MGLFFKTKEKLPVKSEAELRLHRCAFTGHRPERLYGKEADVIRELRKAIEVAIADGYTTFISGGSRGVDLWAADIVLSLRRENKALKLILAIPFEGFEKTGPWIGSSITGWSANRQTGFRPLHLGIPRKSIKQGMYGWFAEPPG